MAHMTNKKRKERDKNALNRGFNGFNTGTRNMGYESNNARKAAAHLKWINRLLKSIKTKC